MDLEIRQGRCQLEEGRRQEDNNLFFDIKVDFLIERAKPKQLLISTRYLTLLITADKWKARRKPTQEPSGVCAAKPWVWRILLCSRAWKGASLSPPWSPFMIPPEGGEDTDGNSGLEDRCLYGRVGSSDQMVYLAVLHPRLLRSYLRHWKSCYRLVFKSFLWEEQGGATVAPQSPTDFRCHSTRRHLEPRRLGKRTRPIQPREVS